MPTVAVGHVTFPSRQQSEWKISQATENLTLPTDATDVAFTEHSTENSRTYVVSGEGDRKAEGVRERGEVGAACRRGGRGRDRGGEG